MLIAYHAYCPLSLICPSLPPPEKDKGKQAAHHIVCEQHAPLFILHRAPASKLVPPSHPILRERKLKPLFRGPETAMQHTGKRQSRAPRPEAYSQKLIVLLKIACAIISTPWHGRERLIVLYDKVQIDCQKSRAREQESERPQTKARTAQAAPPPAPQRLISVSRKSFVMLPVRLIKSKRPECLIISTISTIYLPLRRTYRRLPARSAYNL